MGRTEERVADWAAATAAELGFPRSWRLPPRVLGAATCWCYSRTGETFATEALCISIKRRPRRQLKVDWIVSPHETEYLLANGLSGNAMADDLFYFQVGRGRAPADCLPSAMDLPADPAALEDLLARLRAEIAGGVADMPAYEKAKWQRVVGSR